MNKEKISVDGFEIRLEKIGDSDFVSLTDLARHGATEPAETLRSWMRNTATQQFLATWEKLHNPNFKPGQMAAFSQSAADNRSAVSPQRYIVETGAIGVISKSGRNGGTWAHSDIALQFCYWLSPSFQVYLLKEFQRLKRDEAARASLAWQAEKLKDLLVDAIGWAEMLGDDLKRIP